MFALIERLIFFLFLFSALRSGLQFILRIWRGSQTRAPFPGGQPSRSRGAAPGTAAGSTLLHQDPVCGTFVPVTTSLKRMVAGEPVYFCSQACRDQYLVHAK